MHRKTLSQRKDAYYTPSLPATREESPAGRTSIASSTPVEMRIGGKTRAAAYVAALANLSAASPSQSLVREGSQASRASTTG